MSIRRLADESTNRFLEGGSKGVEEGFKTLAVSKGAVKVLGRVITLTATAKRWYQRLQGLGKRYNPQRTYPPTDPPSLERRPASGRWIRALPTRRRVDVVRPQDLEALAFDESFELAKARGKRGEREREGERGPKPRRKHIHALVELVIPEVLEPKGLVSCNCINRGDILGSGVFAPATAR